ncbi:MAG TPA: hypothetical protein VHW25_09360 [Steroidobacteraceae bacterium]|jgi:hypothetical protein|nr:hypothetical protein [Steroidobacteraceae bacterium]
MMHTRRPSPTRRGAILILATLAGCSAPRVHELPPPNYSLAGVWELNPALSSDTDKILASVQPKLKSDRGRHGPGPGAADGPPAPEVINDPTTDLPPIDISNGGRNTRIYGNGDQNERNAYRPPIDFQTNALLGGQWLKIQQSDTEVSIVNAARSRSYTPGERSVVSVPSGVADQVTGWAGRSYIVDLNPQIGPHVKESYTLSGDGQSLIVKIEVASEGRNKAMSVTRTYDRSTKDPASFHQTLEETLPPTD